MTAPARVAAALERLEAPWWIAGGWALDLFLGRETRAHEDVDVVLLRRDQAALLRHFAGWDLQVAVPGEGLRPWDGSALELPLHELWARRAPGKDWLCELLLAEADGETWVYRRDARVRLPLAQAGGVAGGLPLLAPEIVLLYKSKGPAGKDEADFAAVEPELSAGARRWLGEAIALVHPGHPWLGRLAVPR